MQLNGVDYLFILITLASGFFSMRRGFVSEFISFTSLFCATLLSYCVGKDFSAVIRKVIDIDAINYIVSYGIVFLCSLFCLNYVLSALLSERMLDRKINDILGFLFGFLKSIIIISLIVFLVAAKLPLNDQPDSFKKSFIKNLIYKEVKSTGVVQENLHNNFR